MQWAVFSSPEVDNLLTSVSLWFIFCQVCKILSFYFWNFLWNHLNPCWAAFLRTEHPLPIFCTHWGVIWRANRCVLYYIIKASTKMQVLIYWSILFLNAYEITVEGIDITFSCLLVFNFSFFHLCSYAVHLVSVLYGLTHFFSAQILRGVSMD